MASGSNIDIAVELRLLDQFSNQVNAPIAATNRLKTAMDGVAAQASRNSAAMARLGQAYDNMAARAERAAARMTAARANAMKAAVGLFTLAGPLADASSFQMGTLRLGQIDEWDKAFRERTGRSAYGRDALGNLQLTAEGMAELNRVQNASTQLFVDLSRVTNQSAQDLLASYTTIAGLTDSTLNQNQIADALKAIGMASTASGADVQALTQSFVIAYQNP